MQNGKFSAAAALLVKTLKKVDFLKIDVDKQQTHDQAKKNIDLLHARIQLTYPTFGSPTIPHFSDVPNLPIKGVGFSSSFFLGGILKVNEREKHLTINLFSTLAT